MAQTNRGFPTTYQSPQIVSNLPTNMYDRPAVVVQQAMRGRLGKSLEALLKPENMTPADMQSLTNRFLINGKPTNPVTKTLMDVATNPFMWIGLALWVGPYWKAGTGKFMKKSGGVKAIQNFLNGKRAEFVKEGGRGVFTSPQTTFREMEGRNVEIRHKGGHVEVRHYDEINNQIAANTNIIREEMFRLADQYEQDYKVITAGKKILPVEEELIGFYMGEKNLRDSQAKQGYVTRLKNFVAKKTGKQFDMTDMKIDKLETVMKKRNPALLELAKRQYQYIEDINAALLDAATIKDSKGKYIMSTLKDGTKQPALDREILGDMTKALVDMGILPTLDPSNEFSLYPRILQNLVVDPTMESLVFKQEAPTSFSNLIKSATKRKRAVALAGGRDMALMDTTVTKLLVDEGVLPKGVLEANEALQKYKADKIKGGLAKAVKRVKEVQTGEKIDSLFKVDEYVKLEEKLHELKSKKIDALAMSAKDAAAVQRQILATEAEIKKHYSIASDLGNILEEVGVQKGSDAYKGILRNLETYIFHGLDNNGYNVDTTLQALKPQFEGIAQQLSIPHTFNNNPTLTLELYSKAVQPIVGTLKDNNLGYLTSLVDKTYDKGSLKYNIWHDELIPMMKGHTHPKDFIRKDRWRSKLFDFQKFLGSEMGDKLFNQLPGDMGNRLKANLIANLKDPESMLSRGAFSDAASQYLHLSTLGGNIGAVSKNLMQVPTTVGPVVGSKAMMKGLYDTVKQGVLVRKEYIKMRKLNPTINKDLLKSKALQKVMPEFYKAFGPQHVVEAMVSGDMTREGQLAINLAKSGWMKIKKGLMTPFGLSEQFNRVWAFNSFSSASQAAKMPANDAMRVAIAGTKMTQFTGGVMGQPNVIRGMPSIARQYMHFPLRFMEWMKWTTSLTPDGQGMTFEPLGKAIVGTTAAYEVMKNLFDIDITPGLMFQAMPVPQYENSPFYPFPLVPPAIAAIGYGTQAIAKGETKDLGKLSSLFVPGGIAGRRIYRTLSPKFADYKNRKPDGRIPIYNANKSLLSYQTPGQLIKRSLGIHAAQVDQEFQAVKYLSAQRDKIRDYRKQYIEAMLQNDHNKMGKINKQHKKDFPEIGDLQISQTDIKNYKKYHTMTRLQRALKQMPKEYKDLYEEALLQGSAIQIGKLGDNPQALQQEYNQMGIARSPYPLSLLD